MKPKFIAYEDLIDAIILHTFAQQPIHSHVLQKAIRKRFGLSFARSTIEYAVKKMEQRAEITYVWEQGLTNKRKVYHLTAKGKMRLQNLSTRIELEGV